MARLPGVIYLPQNQNFCKRRLKPDGESALDSSFSPRPATSLPNANGSVPWWRASIGNGGMFTDAEMEIVDWRTHVAPDMGRPQAVINAQIGDYDIFLGIMWKIAQSYVWAVKPLNIRSRRYAGNACFEARSQTLFGNGLTLETQFPVRK
jgi:hypothetical protein